MERNKIGFHRKRGDFFRSKLVLNSNKSKITFLFIVLMFGVVIVLGVMGVYDGFSGVNNLKGGGVGLSPGETITLQGTSEVIISDNFEQRTSETFYYLRTNDGVRYKLNFVSGQGPDLISGKDIEVSGIISNTASGNEFNVENLEMLQSVTAGTEPNPNLGEQRTAVILVNFQDNPFEPLTKEEIWNEIFNESYDLNGDSAKYSTTSWIREVSYEKTWLTGDVYGWYTMEDKNYCTNFEGFYEDVISLTNENINFVDYDRLFIITSEGCSYSGISTLGKINIAVNNEEISLSVLRLSNAWHAFRGSIHELGHGFGVEHAGYLDCGDNIIGGGNCYYNTFLNYGDNFDVMGTSYSGHYNAYHKEKIGGLSPENILEVNKFGNYTIEPLEIGNGVKTLKIPIYDYFEFNPNGGYRVKNYYIEYRRPIGADYFTLQGLGYLYDGAIIHIDTVLGSADTQILDMRPLTDDRLDVALKIGETFHDPIKNLTITTLQLTDNYLKVYIGNLSCSNSLLETGEQCDDGNINNNDACTNQCLNNICGDGYLNVGVEQCDTTIPSGKTCQSLGFVSGKLSCVVPGSLNSCTFDTSLCSLCGNGVINKDKGEECDDGNTNNNDGCTSECKLRCTSGADTIIIDGVIDQNELNGYIEKYYLGNVNIKINNVSNAIFEHLNGCG